MNTGEKTITRIRGAAHQFAVHVSTMAVRYLRLREILQSDEVLNKLPSTFPQYMLWKWSRCCDAGLNFLSSLTPYNLL